MVVPHTVMWICEDFTNYNMMFTKYRISTPRNKLHKHVDSNSHVPFEACHTSSHLFWSRHQSEFLRIVLSQKGGFTGFQVLHIVGCSDPLRFSVRNNISPPLWRQRGHYFNCGLNSNLVSPAELRLSTSPCCLPAQRLRNPGRLLMCLWWSGVGYAMQLLMESDSNAHLEWLLCMWEDS